MAPGTLYSVNCYTYSEHQIAREPGRALW